MPKPVEWPAELSFMLAQLKPEKIKGAVTVTHFDAGPPRERYKYSPKDGFRGTADFSEDTRHLMEAMVGKLTIVDIPGAGRRRVHIMANNPWYPGHAPHIDRQRFSSGGPSTYTITFWFMDEGSAPEEARLPSG